MRIEVFNLTGRNKLSFPPTLRPSGVTLDAQPGTVATSGGGTASAWMYRRSLPGPTLRLRTGDTFRATLENGLAEETIIHWHGLDVPEAADGHPRLAVGPGESYGYEFTVRNRAGTYWYHPHPHGRTGPQVFKGLAGFLFIDLADSKTNVHYNSCNRFGEGGKAAKSFHEDSVSG